MYGLAKGVNTSQTMIELDELAMMRSIVLALPQPFIVPRRKTMIDVLWAACQKRIGLSSLQPDTNE
jgi:hypothetical protein